MVGRVEFDPERVRIHFIHTILRLELENKQNRSEEILFKNDVSRQWHPQTSRPPDLSTSTSISDFSNCNYNSVVYDNLSHRSGTSMSSTDRTMKDYDRVVQTMPSHQDPTNNLIELTNRPSDDDTINLHYDYRNDDYSAESIINSDVVPDMIGIGSDIGHDIGHDIGTVNSFNSTFSEFVERTYNLGGSDYPHHSAYLSSAHSESTSTDIVVSTNIPYDLCDESIPNSDSAPTLDNHKKPIDVTSLLENDGEFRNNPIEALHSDERQLDDDEDDDTVRIDAIKDLLNSDIDIEEAIPSAMVTVDTISKNSIKDTEDDFALSVSDEECSTHVDLDKNDVTNL